MSDQWTWSKVRVIVTGGIGFVGSHLVRRLTDLGAAVRVIDIEEAHSQTLFDHFELGGEVDFVQADLADDEAAASITSWAPDVIFNLAGIPYAPYTNIHPKQSNRANVQTLRTVLQAVHSRTATRLVHASSACVFGATSASPLRVGDAPSPPQHYYTTTKQDAERLLLDASEDEVPHRYSICRFGNIYGPGDRIFQRIIPSLSRQLVCHGRHHNEPLYLSRSGGESVFEFLYVDDAVSALLAAGEYDTVGLRLWQFTGGLKSRTSIMDLANRMSFEYDGNSRNVVFSGGRAPEKTVTKYLDDESTRASLAFHPSTDLTTGIRRTLEWYERHQYCLSPQWTVA